MITQQFARAVAHNDLGAARELLDRGANVNSILTTRTEVCTPLNVAISKGNVTAIKFLLANGADPNLQGRVGDTYNSLPLCQAGCMWSCTSIIYQTIRTLVEHGANVLLQDKNDDCIALHKAAYNAESSAFFLINCCTPEILLRQLYTRNKSGEKILDYAIHNPNGLHPEKNLIEGAVREQAKQKEHLFLVSEFGDLQEVKKCFEGKGSPLSDVNRRNQIGDTALHCASRTGQLSVVKFLLGRKADRLIANDRGCIPLHLSARWNRTEVARSLTSGAEPEIVARQLAARDTDGQTPAELCKFFGHSKLTEYLNQLVACEEGSELQATLLGAPDIPPASTTLEPLEQSLLEKMLERIGKLEADNACLSTQVGDLTNKLNDQFATRTVCDSAGNTGECSGNTAEDDCGSLKHQVDLLRQDVGDLGTIIGRRLERIEATMAEHSMPNVLTRSDVLEILRCALRTSEIAVRADDNNA